MRIVTWNVSFNASIDTFDYISETLAPDVALLQEVTQKIFTSKLPNHYQIFHQTIGGRRRWGSAVLVRNGIAAKQIAFSPDMGWVTGATISTGALAGLSLWSLHARLKDLSEKPHYVVPHLQSLFESFAEQLQRGESLIIGGDLNADREFDKHYLQPTDTRHEPFFDYLENNLHLVNCTKEIMVGGRAQTVFTKRTTVPFQDDYLFLSPNLQALLQSCKIPDRDTVEKYSDHSPVIAELDI